MSKNWTKYLIGILVLAALAISMVRYSVLKPGQFPAGDSIWLLNVTSKFTTADAQTSVQAPLPVETARTRVVKQTFTLPRFNLQRVNRSDKMSPFLIGSTRVKGHHKLTFEYTIHVIRRGKKKSIKKEKTVTPDVLQIYLKNELHERVNADWITHKVNQLKQKSPDNDKFLLNAFNYVSTLNKLPRAFYVQKYSSRARKPSAFDKSLLLASLLRANQIPVRMITGLRLMETLNGDFHYWIQVYYKDKWRSYDPFYNFKSGVPSNYLIFKYNARPFIEPSGAQSIKTEVDISESHDNIGVFSSGIRSFWDVFDLSRLSKDLQDNIAKLLLLPFGVLLTLVFRQLAGVHCFGTFTPTLLALALSIGDIRVTGALFLIVAILTYAARFFMPKKMSRVPRVSIIFTIVALALIFGISMLDFYSLNPAGVTLLLPIVILATLLDRFYTTWDDNGTRLAMIRLGWTAAITVLCYPIVTFSELGEFLVFYPELHLITVAVILSFYQKKKLAILASIPPYLLGEAPKKAKATSETEQPATGTDQLNPDIDTNKKPT